MRHWSRFARRTSPGDSITRGCCVWADIAEADIGLDQLADAHFRLAESASSRGFQTHNIASSQHDICNLGGQCLTAAVADQVECACPAGLAPREPEWPELEPIKIGGKLRNGGIDPPFTP